MHVLNTLLPVIILIGLGSALRFFGFFSREFVTGLSRLTYWVALPALLFYKIAVSEYTLGPAIRTTSVVFTGMIACITVSGVIVFLMKTPGRLAGAFMQGSYRGNLAFVGLPVIVYYFSNQSSSVQSQTEATAVFVLAVMVLFYNVLAVLILLAASARKDSKKINPVSIGKNIVTNPLLISCSAGILYGLFMPEMPFFVSRSLSALSQMVLGTALLCVGAAIVRKPATEHLPYLIIATVIKIVVGPAVGFLAAKQLGLSDNNTTLALLLLAVPTAVSSYVLAEQMDADDQLAASIVVITSIFSFFSMTAIMML
jgi:hypothetical protein